MVSSDATRVFIIICLIVILWCQHSKSIYLNQIAVHIEGGSHIADKTATKHGYTNMGQIGELKDHYLFYHPRISKRSAYPNHEHHQLLSKEPQILWFEQQRAKSRVKRDFSDFNNFTDPLWKLQWYLNGGGHKGNSGNYDMSVKGAWRLGYTGKGVVVSILDDGIERTHDDLKENYDPYASYDVNNNDPDPMPRYDPWNENRHGTRCAGEVSAKSNNNKCVVGAAYNSRIGGVRMLDGDVSDAVEAASLSFNRTHIDIYSSSWGPGDDGRVVDGPGPLAKKAFITGIEQGRGGKGNIFVWASGNGGSAFDSCNCDGYTNSIYTLSISSTSEHGRKPWYLEECSSTLATTYSSGAYDEKKNLATWVLFQISTDLHNRCTTTHTGTSASAPLAAGLVALLLEANSKLTWRDVQYIILLTSNPDPMEDGNWVTNGKKRKVSLRYGYGLMNATAMVDYGLRWINVPPKHICAVLSDANNVNLMGPPYTSLVTTDGCRGTANEVNYLEHVQAKLTLTYYRRGNLVIHLTSPSGTKSTLLPKRPSDVSKGGFNQWAFLSVHFWEENPTGTWKLEIADDHPTTSWPKPPNGVKGHLIAWSLILHGTEDNPIRLKSPDQGGVVSQPATSPITMTTLSPKCHEECLDNCTGGRSDDCRECRNLRMGLLGACVKECPHGYTENQKMCLPCDSKCKNCTSKYGYRPHCYACRDGYFLLPEEGKCSVECPGGYFYGNSDHRVCKKCNNMCETCTQNKDKCTSCPRTLTLMDDKCHFPESICSKGYYQFKNQCVLCDASCLQCKSKDQCVLCHPQSFFHQGKCLRDCPNGYRPYSVQMDKSTAQTECRTCQHGNCSGCIEDFVMEEGICHRRNSCFKQQYYDFIHMKCQNCYPRCSTCYGPGSHECLSCEAPLAYHSYLQTCVTCCKDNEKEGSCCNCDNQGSCLMSEKESQHSSHKTVIAVQKTVIVVASLASVIVVIVAIVIVYTASRKSKLTDWCYKNVRSKFSREVTFFSLHKNHQKQNESTEDAVYTISTG
ncbi:furin-like protease kpc-1 [Ostrea edulis]|uniref:furin-like protease kpc-1 n=1 Tax=Ostrea edulis TaxID=37623 RepID=UPI0024AF80AC|nr:furin-like protease kpc-1 [Ostrea edulis]